MTRRFQYDAARTNDKANLPNQMRPTGGADMGAAVERTVLGAWLGSFIATGRKLTHGRTGGSSFIFGPGRFVEWPFLGKYAVAGGRGLWQDLPTELRGMRKGEKPTMINFWVAIGLFVYFGGILAWLFFSSPGRSTRESRNQPDEESASNPTRADLPNDSQPNPPAVGYSGRVTIYTNKLILPRVDRIHEVLVAFFRTSEAGTWRSDTEKTSDQFVMHFIRGNWGKSWGGFGSKRVALASERDATGRFILATRPMLLECTIRPAPDDLTIVIRHQAFWSSTDPCWGQFVEAEIQALRVYLRTCFNLAEPPAFPPGDATTVNATERGA